MSHQPERKEPDCLNCGTTVAGRYCQVCGQENVVPRQSVGALVKHFVFDIFHFDGKFFDTVRRLLLKPGLVPQQYVTGMRTRYLDPIRMYLFISAFFFLLFFSIGDPVTITGNGERLMTKTERLDYASSLQERTGDSGAARQLFFLLDTAMQVTLHDTQPPPPDMAFRVRIGNDHYWMTSGKRHENLQISSSSSWLNEKLQGGYRRYKQKWGEDTRGMTHDIINNFLHTLPYVLFVSLPFFALILKLLYLRRKRFYYSDHAVFTLYHYIVTFILLLLYFLIGRLYAWLDWGVLRVLAFLVFLTGCAYLLLSMKRFYAQSWIKTVGKFLLLNVLALVAVFTLTLLFVVFSFIQL